MPRIVKSTRTLGYAVPLTGLVSVALNGVAGAPTASEAGSVVVMVGAVLSAGRTPEGRGPDGRGNRAVGAPMPWWSELAWEDRADKGGVAAVAAPACGVRTSVE